MFIMKKLVSRLFFPVPLSLELLFLGLILLWFTRRQRAGKVLATCGALLLAALSTNSVSTALIRPLEHRYPQLAVAPAASEPPGVTYIVILGAFATDDPEVPASARIIPNLLARLMEGVMLQREIPGSKLILSGGNEPAEGMARIARAVGVDAHDILRLAEPRDTEEESQQIVPFVGAHPFILVTSASHMPRAMALFQKRGLRPIPAPTDYLAPRHRPELDDFIPDAYKLYRSQVAIYEYLGLAWGRLRGSL